MKRNVSVNGYVKGATELFNDEFQPLKRHLLKLIVTISKVV